MKKIIGTVSVAFLSIVAAPVMALPTTADVVVIMDESGSMAGEQAWIKGVVTALDTGLVARSLTGNRYGSVGFAYDPPGPGPDTTRIFDVGGVGTPFGTALQFQDVPYTTDGSTEDGYAGIAVANGLAYRAGAAKNYILVTDENRDVTTSDTFASILASLTDSQTLLNAVVNATFACGDGSVALGIASGGRGFKADGAGGYTACMGGVAVSGASTTIADYVDLALASGGAAWNLAFLRGGGLGADSFTAAFLDVKIQEIVVGPVPEPATMSLLGLGLAGLGWARRRQYI